MLSKRVSRTHGNYGIWTHAMFPLGTSRRLVVWRLLSCQPRYRFSPSPSPPFPARITGTTLATCLREIDRCRPYFCCMLGDRYGWASHAGKEDALLMKNFDTAKEALVRGAAFILDVLIYLNADS